MPANLVDDADIGVVQRGGGTCLTLEPLDSQTISRHFTRKQLDGNRATERRVLGQVHHPHAAFTKLFDNPVMRNGCANHRARQLYTFVRDVPAGSGRSGRRNAPDSCGEVASGCWRRVVQAARNHRTGLESTISGFPGVGAMPRTMAKRFADGSTESCRPHRRARGGRRLQAQAPATDSRTFRRRDRRSRRRNCAEFDRAGADRGSVPLSSVSAPRVSSLPASSRAAGESRQRRPSRADKRRS